MRKVKRLFQTMDASGDGSINLEEFSKLVKSPKLKLLRSMKLLKHPLRPIQEFHFLFSYMVSTIPAIEPKVCCKEYEEEILSWVLQVHFVKI